MLRRDAGLTLIELMIAIAILGLVVTFALPSYSTWIQNTQVRNAAEAIQNGMRLARTEAVRRNTMVQFVMGAGAAWTVNAIDAAGVVAEQIQSHNASDGTSTATLTLFSGSPPVADSTATRLTFNGLGRVIANPGGAATLTQVAVDSSVLAEGDSRELQINVGVGGDVRMCDPHVDPDTDDPRKCPSL
jgi:type IV fimbrial biogenesis protein FimT